MYFERDRRADASNENEESSHSSVVDELDSISPILNRTPVRVKDCEVDSRVSVGLPRHVPSREKRMSSRSRTSETDEDSTHKYGVPDM